MNQIGIKYRLRWFFRSGVRVIAKRVLPVGCFAWNPAREDGVTITMNFGDDLFCQLVPRILGRSVSICNRTYMGRKLLVGGSTIDNHASNRDAIWGAGVRDGGLPAHIKKMDVRAVRGPLTAEVLRERGIDVPECYGDPAILLPKFFPEWRSSTKKWKVGVVPHYSEHCDDAAEFETRGIRLIHPTQDCESVIREITSCERIVASSLHGIICSEVYDIPVVPYRMKSLTPEPEFKYRDYFLSTGRDWNPASSLEVALSEAPRASPDLTVMAEALLAAFPRELRLR